MPLGFRASAPAIDFPGGFGGGRAEEGLKEFQPWIVFGNAATDVAAADIVFGDPEENQAHADGHGVIELAEIARRALHPAERFGDGRAARSGRLRARNIWRRSDGAKRKD